MATHDEWTKWSGWLDSIEEYGVNLTSWEEQFIDSMRTKFNRFGSNIILSEAQIEQLERIYAERV